MATSVMELVSETEAPPFPVILECSLEVLRSVRTGPENLAMISRQQVVQLCRG